MKKAFLFIALCFITLAGVTQTPSHVGDVTVYTWPANQQFIGGTHYFQLGPVKDGDKWYIEFEFTRTNHDTVTYDFQVCEGPPRWNWKNYAGLTTEKYKATSDVIAKEDPLYTAALYWRMRLVMTSATDTLTLRSGIITTRSTGK